MWGSTGHRIINLKSGRHLPASMAGFKSDSTFFSNHASDADTRKDTSGTSFFAESWRHYIDIDLYPNFQNISHDLNTVIMQYGSSTVRSRGTNPWAVVMVFDSLVNQFKRHDTSRAKQTMADLGHYIGDAYNPLHCTENYDGKSTGNDGIHSRYESGMVGAYQSSIIITQDTAQYISSPIDFIFDVILYSNSLVDSIMAADNYAKVVSGWSGSGSVPASYYTALWQKTGAFTKVQFQKATVTLASFWYTASVKAQSHVITASSGLNGTIIPSGPVTVNAGGSQRFTFNPELGYHIDSVLIDGEEIDSADGYTFINVNSSHTIEVKFAINTNIITSIAGEGGSIIPTPEVTVNYGSSQIFVITPDFGYQIDSVLIDNDYVGNTSPDTIKNITAPHTIRCVFSASHVITMNVSVVDKWNLISVPLGVDDYSTTTLYPAAVSDAFTYNGTYNSSVELHPGVGYWLKFDGSQTVTITGSPIIKDTININAGWNIIGALSLPLPVANIIGRTPGLELSQFYGYNRGYYASDTLYPGSGYWVKSNIAGIIILSAASALMK